MRQSLFLFLPRVNLCPVDSAKADKESVSSTLLLTEALGQ